MSQYLYLCTSKASEESTCCRPLRFATEGLPRLPKAVQLDASTGALSGVPDEVSEDFIKYTLAVANDVGLAYCALNFLVSYEGGSNGRVVNKDAEARVGQVTTQFTCFTSKRVQILTPEEQRASACKPQSNTYANSAGGAWQA